MPYRAFVSSTFEDLRAHREYAISALRSAGFDVDPMEDWTAASDEPKQFSQDRMKGCDLCVLIVGLRRGFVPADATLSITQMEYEAANKEGVDVLVFMLDEDAPWPRKFDEFDSDPDLRTWRANLMSNHGVGFFDNNATSMEIGPALTRWVSEQNNSRDQSIDLEHVPASLHGAVQLARSGELNDGVLLAREQIANTLRELDPDESNSDQASPPMATLRKLRNRLPPSAVERLELAIAIGGVALSGDQVDNEDARRALAAAAEGLRLVTEPRIEVRLTRRGYKYSLRTPEGSKILESDTYTNRASLDNGLRSLARNIADDNRVQQFTDRRGKHGVRILAPNAEILATASAFAWRRLRIATKW